MLTKVVAHFFMPDEIESLLSDPEQQAREYFTTPAEVFGESFKIDTNPERVAAALSRRIYHIRNTLVHNKEGDLPRFVPYSGQDEVLRRELPLVLFLAEQLIIKTGKELAPPARPPPDA